METVRRTKAAWQRVLDALEARPLLLCLAAVGIAAGVSLAMASVSGWTRIDHVLGHLELWWLVVVVAGWAISYLGYTVAHHRTAALCGAKLTRRASLYAVTFGAAATCLRSGYSVDHRALRHGGAEPESARVGVLNLAVLEYAALAPAAWICALILLHSQRVQQQVTVPWAVGVPVGVALAVAIGCYFGRRVPTGAGPIASTVRGGLLALCQLGHQLRHPVRNREAWLGMATHWASDIAALWAALLMTGVHPAPAIVILGFATGYACTPRSMPLTGVGVTEALMPLAFMWEGVPLASAVVAVFIYRLARLVLAVPPALLTHEQVRRMAALPAVQRALAH
ncbi:MAG TPA: lysylphosphatidylglycerol synthase domain-containing protein [Solirubrobacteraceae bacterium]|jgi:uncharacterized membrane protein YbhN (UPF0104 family)|nr:lysylphosphatidylglycerol synthase domain-containing protein [Solirubrobacteraceae bacterium]